MQSWKNVQFMRLYFECDKSCLRQMCITKGWMHINVHEFGRKFPMIACFILSFIIFKVFLYNEYYIILNLIRTCPMLWKKYTNCKLSKYNIDIKSFIHNLLAKMNLNWMVSKKLKVTKVALGKWWGSIWKNIIEMSCRIWRRKNAKLILPTFNCFKYFWKCSRLVNLFKLCSLSNALFKKMIPLLK